MKNRNVILIQNLLRSLDLESLRNPEVISNLVRIFGIMPWGPSTTGPEAQYINPGGIAAIGQTPDQIAKALVYLSKFKIESFCEVGVCYGGNFFFMSEYLRRFNPTIQCTGVDPTMNPDSDIREIIDLSDWMRHLSLTSNQIAGREYDLVFIDGDHVAPWPENDWNNLGKQAKICMFHDLQEPIWPDVAAFWITIKGLKGKVTMEYLDDPSGRSTHGIGLIHDKGAA